jgi:hypothetical protein
MGLLLPFDSEGKRIPDVREPKAVLEVRVCPGV